MHAKIKCKFPLSNYGGFYSFFFYLINIRKKEKKETRQKRQILPQINYSRMEKNKNFKKDFKSENAF